MKQPTAVRHLSSEWAQYRSRPPPVSAFERADIEARLDRILSSEQQQHHQQQPKESSAARFWFRCLITLPLVGVSVAVYQIAGAVAESAADAKLSPEMQRHKQQMRGQLADYFRDMETKTQHLVDFPRPFLLVKKHRSYLRLLQRIADHIQFEQSSIGWMAAAHRIVSLYGPTILRLCGQHSGAEADVALSHAHWILCVEEAVWRIGAQRNLDRRLGERQNS